MMIGMVLRAGRRSVVVVVLQQQLRHGGRRGDIVDGRCVVRMQILTRQLMVLTTARRLPIGLFQFKRNVAQFLRIRPDLASVQKRRAAREILKEIILLHQTTGTASDASTSCSSATSSTHTATERLPIATRSQQMIALTELVVIVYTIVIIGNFIGISSQIRYAYMAGSII